MYIVPLAKKYGSLIVSGIKVAKHELKILEARS